MPAIRLDPWTHIKEVSWRNYTHLAFPIDLGVGVPGSDFTASCGSAVPATGQFVSGWSTGYGFPFARSANVSGYRGGEWDAASVAGVSIEGLPFTDTVAFDPGTVSPKVLQTDSSFITPVSGGASGIVVPGRSDFFSGDISARADLASIMMDGGVYCADTAPLGDGIGERGANALFGGALVAIGISAASILSRVTVTYHGRTWSPAGTFTIPRTISGFPYTGQMPKTLWCLFQRP